MKQVGFSVTSKHSPSIWGTVTRVYNRDQIIAMKHHTQLVNTK